MNYTKKVGFEPAKHNITYIMKLLIITQKVDSADGLLGFFHDWLKEFAEVFSEVTVICLFEGQHELPGNVRVLSLGKEKGVGRIFYLFNFYYYLWRERKNYDAVFVHMNAEYVILGGCCWRLAGKKIGLWYTHKAVTWKLRLAELLSDVIFTASKESFQLASAKLRIIGHGIDVNKFSLKNLISAEPDKFRLVSVGRISEIKNLLLLVKAIDLLVHKFGLDNLTVSLIGEAPNNRGLGYAALLKNEIKKLRLEKYIDWVGNIPNRDLPRYYHQADLSVNLCPTGGLDKAVLESMACGVPALVYNKTFREIFGDYQEQLIVSQADQEEVAKKIRQLLVMKVEDKNKLSRNLRQIVVSNYSVHGLIGKIIKSYEDQK